MLAAVCHVSLATATPCQILPISGSKTDQKNFYAITLGTRMK